MLPLLHTFKGTSVHFQLITRQQLGRELTLTLPFKNTITMAGKVVLHYFNGRGKMESIRWLLTVAEVEFDEIYLTTREQYEKLLSDGALMFQQVPMVEIDGMKLVQTKAILKYIAEKYNLHGKDLKDRVMIDMYSEGIFDSWK
ncbi:hypothetical protein FQN60_017444 [Etheostoma spectabile]|uniref:glutathione transferase n=1 Tax=Etheostoma spectabile TaxID=54343 RepID=A0A5J5CBS4_9PERO|nr:hypothetical protein FQN60_017444 [Etheostoma spectabile]